MTIDQNKRLADLLRASLSYFEQRLRQLRNLPGLSGEKQNLHELANGIREELKTMEGSAGELRQAAEESVAGLKSIPAAEQAKTAMTKILNKLGTRSWEPAMGTGQFALPPDLVATMAHLARTPAEGASVYSAARKIYKAFYADVARVYSHAKVLETVGFVKRERVLTLEEARWGLPGQLTEGGVPKMTESGKPIYGRSSVQASDRPLELTDEGKKSLVEGNFGPHFESFKTAFNSLPETDQAALGQHLTEIAYQRGKAPANLLPPAVQAYGNLGVAQMMSARRKVRPNPFFAAVNDLGPEKAGQLADILTKLDEMIAI